MPKTAAYTLCWSSAQETYELFQHISPTPLPIVIGSRNWFDWLTTISSFSFQGRYGSYTARKEHKQRGSEYWHAYKRLGGKLVKKYVGKNEDITVTRLEEIGGLLTTQGDVASRDAGTEPITVSVRPLHSPASTTPHVPLDRGSTTTTARFAKSPATQHPATVTDSYSRLLVTKLHIPRPRGPLVRRARLIELFKASLKRELTLLTAPTGFGKTTILSSWLIQTPVLAAWVSLDSGDNELTRFWSYVLAALNRAWPGLTASELLLLQSSRPPAIEALLTTAINSLEMCAREIVLVLDDYHHITTQAVHNSLAFLLEHLPPNLHLVIATRADPPLPLLGRWRARGQLVEVRTNELRFTLEEAQAFFRLSGILQLLPGEIDALETRTEGWIAGLQLAALSLQRHTDAASFIEEFTGSHRHVADYLVQDVLAQQPDAIQFFLMQTAILDRLRGDLCEAVTQQEGGQATLERLERANLFLVPLDDERRWYRYHHLFGDMLRQRLQDTQPALVAILHCRAAHWYEQHGFLEEAIRHFLEADDRHAASLLVEQRGEALIKRGDFAQLLHWLELFPYDVVQSRLHLCLLYAQTLALIGYHARADTILPVVEHLLEESAQICPDSDTEKRTALQKIRDDVLVLQITLHIYQGRFSPAFELARTARAYLPAQCAFQRGSIAMALGVAYMSLSNTHAAYEELGEVVAIGETAGIHNLVIALANRASMLANRGKLREAATAYREALQRLNVDTLPSIPAACMLYLGLADILREWNQLDQAEPLLLTGIELAKRWGFSIFLALLYIVAGRVKMARSDVDGAIALLDEGKKLVQADSSTIAVARVDAYRVRFSLVKGDTEAVDAWMREYRQDLQGTLDLTQEREYLALIRVHLAKGDHDDALAVALKLLEAAEAISKIHSIITVLVTLALVYAARKEMTRATTILSRAIDLAEPANYLRVFIDEGQPMAQLLAALWEQHRSPRYIERLLAYLEPKASNDARRARSSTTDADQVCSPELSERELDVLFLVAKGCSNREIAEQLVVATSTVKSHINALYSKLHVENRARAIAQARKFNLLP